MKKRINVQYSTEKDSLNLDKVLLIYKVSRLEVERFSHPNLSDRELEKFIRNRGIDYDSLKRHHNINKEFQSKILSCFKNFGIRVREVNR